MVLAEFFKFKHGLYKSCGIEWFEGIMLEPCLLQPCFHVAGVAKPSPCCRRSPSGSAPGRAGMLIYLLYITIVIIVIIITSIIVTAYHYHYSYYIGRLVVSIWAPREARRRYDQAPYQDYPY